MHHSAGHQQLGTPKGQIHQQRAEHSRQRAPGGTGSGAGSPPSRHCSPAAANSMLLYTSTPTSQPWLTLPEARSPTPPRPSGTAERCTCDTTAAASATLDRKPHKAAHRAGRSSPLAALRASCSCFVFSFSSSVACLAASCASLTSIHASFFLITCDVYTLPKNTQTQESGVSKTRSHIRARQLLFDHTWSTRRCNDTLSELCKV